MQGFSTAARTRLLPSPFTAALPWPAPSHIRHTFFPVAAASGKGFGELLKQKKGKGKEDETIISPLSPGRGFGDAQKKKSGISKEDDDDEDDVAADDDADDLPTACPCGGGENKLGYGECCMPYHQGTAVAPDGLSLLKARFSAYALGIVGYVVNTTHPENPDFGDNLLADVQATCDRLKFYKLHIMDQETVSDRESTVCFRVVYGLRKGGRGDRKVLEEKSYFLREGDTWLFKDGEALSQASQAEWMLSSTTNDSEANLGRKAAPRFRTKSKLRPRKV